MSQPQPSLFDEPLISARYWEPEDSALPACDTCARYKPEQMNSRGVYGFGAGTCPANGAVTCFGYCAMHEETRSRKELAARGYRRGA